MQLRTARAARIAGVPVGQEITGNEPYASNFRRTGEDDGSIIIVVATDAPLLPHQMKRLARRASLGLARTGSTSGNGSGDHLHRVFDGERGRRPHLGPGDSDHAAQREMNRLFEATVQATEEAIVNAMVGAETMTGFEGHTVIALPHDRLQEVLKKYNRLSERPPLRDTGTLVQ